MVGGDDGELRPWHYIHVYTRQCSVRIHQTVQLYILIHQSVLLPSGAAAVRIRSLSWFLIEKLRNSDTRPGSVTSLRSVSIYDMRVPESTLVTCIISRVLTDRRVGQHILLDLQGAVLALVVRQ